MAGMNGLLVTSAVLMTCLMTRGVEGHIFTENLRPNLLFIVMDDMGWNDFGVHDPRMVTPTLDLLYNEGFRLNYSYTDPAGSSTRAAIFSGKFPYTMGLQDSAIHKFSSAHVPLSHHLLPMTLKLQGYFNHMIGKWDQGFCNVDQTPTYRGFDTFFGQYTASTNHSTLKTEEGFYDVHDNENVMTDSRFAGMYSTEMWGKRAIKIIKQHKRRYPLNEHPFFIMLSLTAIRAPNVVPQKHIRKCRFSTFTSDERRAKCGMMAAVDLVLYRVMRALEDSEQHQNTIVFFTSDGGGDKDEGSSNWPLRGSKGSVWEGGIRVPSFIWSANSTLLPKQNFTYTGLFHAVDWYPTAVGFAMKIGKPKLPKRIAPTMDGRNHWKLIKMGTKKSFRTQFAYLVNETRNVKAYVRDGDFKLIVDEKDFPGWYTPPLTINASELVEPKVNYKRKPFLLYNIRKDPSETRDLSKSKVKRNAEARDALLDLFETFKAKYVAKETGNVNSNPANHPEYNNVWSPGSC